MNVWFDRLGKDLRERAYRSGCEFAWPRDAALKVLERVSKSNLRILGVDVWIPREGGPLIPAPYVYAWAANDVIDAMNYRDAEDFIRGFNWADDDHAMRGFIPYFNLTFDHD